MLERVRNPKWMAIGFAALVVVGVIIKVLPRGDDATEPTRARTAAAAVPELGRYELEHTSWSSAPTATAKPEPHEQQSTTKMPRNVRRWSGICVAIQGN